MVADERNHYVVSTIGTNCPWRIRPYPNFWISELGTVDRNSSHDFFVAVHPAGGSDPERAHLAIEVAALDAERVGGPRDVALLSRQRPQDVVALEPLARVVQRQRRCPRTLTPALRRPVEETTDRRAVMVSPGTMIISRSITLRSSRTLPGQR